MEVTKPVEDNRFSLSSTVAPSGMAMALSLSSEVPVDARQATSTQKLEPVHHGPWYPLVCLCGHYTRARVYVCVCVCVCVRALSRFSRVRLCNPMDCDLRLTCPLHSSLLHHLGSPSVAITNYQPPAVAPLTWGPVWVKAWSRVPSQLVLDM